MASPVPTSARPRAETTRMFESDLIERFSRIHPATPFVFWIPVVLLFLFRSTSRNDLGAPAALGMFGLGIITWTLAEYLLHRFVFHWTGETALAKRLHFLIHGVHHEFPRDKDRLVMPLGASISFGILFYALFYVLMGHRIGEPFFAGFVLGYLGYDGTHYAVHHFRQTTRIGKWVKRHHMRHHHADHHGGFGVSTPLWDLVFQTMPNARPQTGPRTRKASEGAGLEAS
jgi:sterol desaturase/sphingolipid hydroxylase (fatty acid hydroxylase superfamily)